MKPRNNKQIWRLAEHLHNIFAAHGPYLTSWYIVGQVTRNRFYDAAAELLKKIANNEFTGADNHE